MSERGALLKSIAETAKDYREGEVSRPNTRHVDRWIRQFDEPTQLPILRELDHVLKRTYFSKSKVRAFFANQIDHERFAGSSPRRFWQSAHLLDIQNNGCSQAEIRALFGEALEAKYGLAVDDCGSKGGAFVYLDDVLFTGGRIGSDLSAWIERDAPPSGAVHVLVIAAHRFGEWKCSERLRQSAREAGKDLEFHFWAALRIENRKAYRDESEVLWPASLPGDAALRAYMNEQRKFPFVARRAGTNLRHAVFSSEEGRQALETGLLLAGMRIRSFSQNPAPSLRPLGFSPFGLGFGSLIVTYRNCPNNCPLALWWGDPEASPNHPFSKWYPLFPRKTYEAEIDFDEFDF